jgi:hypothetical protein
MVAAVDGDPGAAAQGPRRRAAPPAVASVAASALTTAVAAAVPSRTLPAPLSRRSTRKQPAAPARVACYAAVGVSEPVGHQPQAGRRHGAPTTQGYANDLLARERSRWPGLRLVHGHSRAGR